MVGASSTQDFLTEASLECFALCTRYSCFHGSVSVLVVSRLLRLLGAIKDLSTAQLAALAFRKTCLLALSFHARMHTWELFLDNFPGTLWYTFA